MNPDKWVYNLDATPSLYVSSFGDPSPACVAAVHTSTQAVPYIDEYVNSEGTVPLDVVGGPRSYMQPEPYISESDDDGHVDMRPGNRAGINFVTHDVEQPVTARLVTEWLPLAQADLLCIVAVTEDSVVLSVPTYSERPGVLSCASSCARSHNATAACPVSFMTIQRMSLLDGTVIVAVCSNPGCERLSIQDQLFRWEAQEPYRGDTYPSVFANADAICRCARAAIVALFGVDGGDSLELKPALDQFEEWFDTEHMWSAFQSCLKHVLYAHLSYCRRGCVGKVVAQDIMMPMLAGRDGDSITVKDRQYTFSKIQDGHIGHQGWAVLQHVHSGRIVLRCHACTRVPPPCYAATSDPCERVILTAGVRTSCPHVAAMGSVRRPAGASVDRFLDPITGARKLTCKSRLSVPQEIHSSAYGVQYEGVALPCCLPCCLRVLQVIHCIASLISDIQRTRNIRQVQICYILAIDAGYVDGQPWRGEVDTSETMPRCSCADRVLMQREVHAVVFRLQTYSKLLIAEKWCSVCGLGSFDGAESLLLRKASVRSQVWQRLSR